MSEIERYKIDKDIILNYDHDNPPRHGSCCYAEVVESREFDSLQRQVDELTAALERWHQIHDAIVDVLEGRPVTDDHTLVASIKGLTEKLWKDVEKGDDLDRIRALVLALPKVEGELIVGYNVWTGKGTEEDPMVCWGRFEEIEHASSYAALLRARQGMEE